MINKSKFDSSFIRVYFCHRFVVVDGAMTEVIRPCLYGAYHHIDLTDKTHAGEDSAHVYDIVGPVCESSDFLGKVC